MNEQRRTSRQLQLPQSVHAAFIYINARLFLMVRRIKSSIMAKKKNKKKKSHT